MGGQAREEQAASMHVYTGTLRVYEQTFRMPCQKGGCGECVAVHEYTGTLSDHEQTGRTPSPARAEDAASV
jgi:hypothetical protein